jgi:hypothetical protein
MVKIVFKKHAVMGDVIAVQRLLGEAGLEQKFKINGKCYTIRISVLGIEPGLSAHIRKMKGVSKITISTA